MAPMSVWKTLGLLLAALLLVGVLLFGRQVYVYYSAIQSGQVNPLLDQRLESSVSHMIANQHVSKADLDLLADPSSPSIGSTSPTLTIVEFLDFECPYCEAAFQPVREGVLAHQDKVKLVVRNFPLEDIHPGATHAAYAGYCAQEQGKFWEYHDKLYLNQTTFTDNDLLNFAKQVGLDLPKFNACIGSDRAKNAVEHDQAVGLSAGVEGTPTFFFNGVKIQGAPSADAFDFLVNKFLSAK
jgi:protein-disulfide isomerase